MMWEDFWPFCGLGNNLKNEKNLTYESYFWLYTSHLQAVNFIGCLKKLKFRLFGLPWTQPRKKKEERRKKKEERESKFERGKENADQEDLEFEGGKTVRYEFEKLRVTPMSGVVREWESVFFFLLLLLLFLVSVRYAFTGRNSRISPVWPVFFPVRNKGGICTGLLTGTVYTGRTGRYGTKLTSLAGPPLCVACY